MPTYDLSKPIPPDQWLTAERLRKLRRDAIDTLTEPGEEESQFAVCAAVDELTHRQHATVDATIGQLRMRDIADMLDGAVPDLVVRSALYWLNHLANLQRAATTGDVGEFVKQAEALDRTIEQHTLDIEDVKRRLAKLETAPAALSPIKWLDRVQAGDALEARIDGRWHEAVIHELVANERGKVTAIKVRITEANYPPARAIVLFLMVTDPATTNFSVHDNLRPSRDPRPASWSDAHHAWLMSLKEGDEVELLKAGRWTRCTITKRIPDGFEITVVEKTYVVSMTDALVMFRRPRVGSGG
jgi:hypothetical protein